MANESAPSDGNPQRTTRITPNHPQDIIIDVTLSDGNSCGPQAVRFHSELYGSFVHNGRHLSIYRAHQNATSAVIQVDTPIPGWSTYLDLVTQP